MDQAKPSKCLHLVQQQIASQEALLGYHFKLEAMTEMILAKDLIECSPAVLHDYLWVMNDLIVNAKELNKHLLDLSIKASHHIC